VREDHRLVEPATLYSVGRLQRDILHSSSNVGFIATGVVREKDLDAFTAGPDFNLRWDNAHYNWNGHYIATRAPTSGVMRDGSGGVTNFNFNSKHLNVFAHFDHFDKGFRNTDLGFLGSRVNSNSLSSGFKRGETRSRQVFPRGIAIHRLQPGVELRSAGV